MINFPCATGSDGREPDRGHVRSGSKSPMGFPMNISAEFRKRAAECGRMAKTTPDPFDRGAWKRLEERWLRCADLVDSRNLTAQHHAPAEKQHRRSTVSSH
jgi:hypothetical protein